MKYLLLSWFVLLASCGGGSSDSTSRKNIDRFDFFISAEPSIFTTIISPQLVDGINNDVTAERKLNALLSLPASDIDIVFKDCGQANAFYDPSLSAIIMCWDLLADMVSTYPGNVDAVIDLYLQFVFFHELGHALVDQYDLPILGKPEDVADDIAVVLSIVTAETMGEELTAAWSFINAGIYFNSGVISWADVHTTGPQRQADLTCMAIGAVPAILDDPAVLVVKPVIDGLATAGRDCEKEFVDKAAAVESLFGQYVKGA